MATTTQELIPTPVVADSSVTIKNVKDNGDTLESGDRDSGTWSCDSALAGEQSTQDTTQTAVPLPPPPPPVPRYIAFTVPLAPPPPPLPGQHTVTTPQAPPPSASGLPECCICYDTMECTTLHCCGCKVCRSCTNEIVATNINEGRAYISCPNPECAKGLKREFIIQHIDSEMKNKYERFRLNYEMDNTKKTCPNCCYITERDLPKFTPRRKQLTPDEYHIKCKECAFDWCFNCHSPWHEIISCEENRRGDQHFYKWTKSRRAGFIPNCQKCPKCKVYIQRSEGCDSMTCNQCQSNFCYKCGGYFRDFPGLGSHYERHSVFGCPYNFSPNNPLKRRTFRGTNLCGKLSTVVPVVGYPGLIIGGVGVVVVVVIVALPIVGGVVGTYKLHKYIKKSIKNRNKPKFYRR